MTIYEHLRSLLAIPSPSWREDGVSAYIIDRMTECGYAFRDDECGNLLFCCIFRKDICRAIAFCHIEK